MMLHVVRSKNHVSQSKADNIECNVSTLIEKGYIRFLNIKTIELNIRNVRPEEHFCCETILCAYYRPYLKKKEHWKSEPC